MRDVRLVDFEEFTRSGEFLVIEASQLGSVEDGPFSKVVIFDEERYRVGLFVQMPGGRVERFALDYTRRNLDDEVLGWELAPMDTATSDRILIVND